jgi:hypothetical protein
MVYNNERSIKMPTTHSGSGMLCKRFPSCKGCGLLNACTHSGWLPGQIQPALPAEANEAQRVAFGLAQKLGKPLIVVDTVADGVRCIIP